MERLTKSGTISGKDINELLDESNENQMCKTKAYYKLQEYEDLEEQGRLVILPCKVGDTLYRLVPNLYREYVEIKIAQFVINKNGIYFITDKGVSWSADKIGKTVFLTKSEAEQKLKEMESD